MRSTYIFTNRNIKVYEILKIPRGRGVFLHNPELKDHWGTCIYTLHCPDGFYTSHNNEDDSLVLQLYGKRMQTNDALYQGNSYCVVNETGAYVCIYKVKQGNVYTAGEGKDVRIILQAEMVYARDPGDQLAQIFIPDTCKIHDENGINYIT